MTSAALLAALALLAGCDKPGTEKGETAAAADTAVTEAAKIAFPAPPAPEADAEFPQPAACAKVAGLRPPAEDLPDAKTAAALKDCSSAALYYGLGGPKDAAKARQCAFAQLVAPKDAALEPVSGPAVLMMIYANGDGVKRDLDLATQMACRMDIAAPAETEGRVERLQAMKTGPAPKEPFDYCDDVTSGYAGGVCASLDADRAKDAREARLAAATSGWTPPQKAALAAFRKAQSGFAQAHAGERDLSGTLRAAFQIQAEEEVYDFDAALLEKLAKGRPPAGSPAALASADAKLNQVYQGVVGWKDQEYGTVTADDVRGAQRAWLKYRDAWLAVGRARGVQTDGLAEAVTVERTRQLACGDYGPEVEGYACE